MLRTAHHTIGHTAILKGIVAIGGVVILFVFGCAGQKVSTKASPQADWYRVNEIVVLPFQTLGTPQATGISSEEFHVPEEVVESDISLATPRSEVREVQQEIAVPSESGLKVSQIFAGALARHSGVLVHSPLEAQQHLKRVSASVQDLSQEKIGQAVAQELNADAALIGLLRVYKEREGGKFGADPAVVGYEVTLIARDGSPLWHGNYYEAQRPVTEDIGGFLSRGFGFFTAEELASYGAKELAKQFPFGAQGRKPVNP